MDEVDDALILAVEESIRVLHSVDTSLLHLTDLGKACPFDEAQVASTIGYVGEMAHGNTMLCEQALQGLDALRATRRGMAKIERRNRRLSVMLPCALGVIVAETFFLAYAYYEARPHVEWVQACGPDGCRAPVPLSELTRPEEQHPKEPQPSQPMKYRP
jgi:hypothetical protein